MGSMYHQCLSSPDENVAAHGRVVPAVAGVSLPAVPAAAIAVAVTAAITTVAAPGDVTSCRTGVGEMHTGPAGRRWAADGSNARSDCPHSAGPWSRTGSSSHEGGTGGYRRRGRQIICAAPTHPRPAHLPGELVNGVDIIRRSLCRRVLRNLQCTGFFTPRKSATSIRTTVTPQVVDRDKRVQIFQARSHLLLCRAYREKSSTCTAVAIETDLSSTKGITQALARHCSYPRLFI